MPKEPVNQKGTSEEKDLMKVERSVKKDDM
jgi:hypothetical protein